MCKINVNFSRKVSDNNFGSRGAGVSFEFDVDTTQMVNAQEIQDRIRKTFRLAQKAVDQELARYQSDDVIEPSTPKVNGKAAVRPEPQPTTVAITGKAAYAVRDQIKALGGRWDAEAKVWRVPAANAAAVNALVAAV